MKRGFVAAVLLLLAGATAQAVAAAPRCYSPAEIEADRAIQFQTELMVVSEACRDSGAYLSFRRRNAELIRHYQQRMIEHFRRTGAAARAEATFDSYATRLANEASLRNSRVPAASLCRGTGTVLAAGKSLDAPAFRRYASAEAARHLARYRVCDE